VARPRARKKKKIKETEVYSPECQALPNSKTLAGYQKRQSPPYAACQNTRSSAIAETARVTISIVTDSGIDQLTVTAVMDSNRNGPERRSS